MFPVPYRGRIAPTPTGYLHLGHAQTFWLAQQRATQADGTLVLRVEDLDHQRCKPPYSTAMVEDLTWFGLRWQEGPDVGGAYGPYTQSQRLAFYRQIWHQLAQTRTIYPSPHSRRDVAQALRAPHAGDREPVFPTHLRPDHWSVSGEPGEVNWRFRVPDGDTITVADGRCGQRAFVAGVDFGDFIVWRRDGFPSYDLAVVADDHAMAITEVVRGEDLLLAAAKQTLLYRALGWMVPAFYHGPLVCDASGQRLAKRDGARSLRALREAGHTPADLRAQLPALGPDMAPQP